MKNRFCLRRTATDFEPASIAQLKNYRIKLSDKPGGLKWTYVRIMPGKVHSKNPSQQKPYVNQRINGQSVDKHGNIVPNKSEEAHIPLDEYIYREITRK